MRLLYPELDPSGNAGSGADGTTSLYLALRGGSAMPVHRHVFGSVEARPELASIAGTFDQFYGAAVGVNFGRHFGIEIPCGGYGMRLNLPGVGVIGDYALYDIIPELRLRYPLMADRLEPYAIGGIGITYAEFNDRTPRTTGIREISTDGFGFGGVVGAGVEYFLAKNIAVGCEARYLFDRSHDLTIESTTRDGNLDSFPLTLSLRVMLFEWRRWLPSWLES